MWSSSLGSLQRKKGKTFSNKEGEGEKSALDWTVDTVEMGEQGWTLTRVVSNNLVNSTV